MILGCSFGFGANSSSSSSSITGAGTPPKVPKFTAGNVIADSQISDDGTTVFIGASATSTSALFEVQSTTQGALFPRMTTVERDLIPVGGTEDSLFIYNTSLQKYQYYDDIAGVWQTMESSTIGGETWSGVLTNGATSGGVSPLMSNGDVIKAVNGGGQLNLRVGSDSIYDLTNDNGGYTQSWVYGDTTNSTLGFATSTVDISSGSILINTDTTNLNNRARANYNSTSLLLELTDGVGGTTIGEIGIRNNKSGIITTTNKTNFPSHISSQEAVFDTGVLNSVALGGLRLNVKTANTAYATQFGFSDTAIVGGYQTLLQFAAPSADNVQTFQNASGTIALTSNITSTLYNGNGAVGSGRVATLTDTITFSGGQFNITGSGSTTATTSFLVRNSGSVEMFKILDNGYIGINITPSTTFHVNGISTFENTILVSGANSINFNSSGFTRIQGNVATLVTEITGEGGVLLKDSLGNSFLDSTKSGFNGDRITLLDGGLFDFKQAGSGDTTAYLNIGSNNLYVNLVTGNIGFGTASPTAKLEIQGSGSTSATTSLLVRNSGASEMFSVRDDGQVNSRDGYWIGTIKFLHYGQATGGVNDNTFVGKNTGASTLAGGAENVGIGVSSMLSNTSGYNNVAVGAYSLQSNTTGFGSVAIGAYAVNMYIGNGAVGVGINALRLSNKAGTAIGRSALQANTDGDYNTAVGDEALRANTTGSYNTAVGLNALYSNVTGQFNVAMGVQTLLSSTVSSNTGLGDAALYSTTTGGSNTAVGRGALYLNTTGSENVALGVDAGRFITGGSTANQTSTTSVYLGNLTKASVDGNSNEIVIGYDATGNGSNSVTLGATTITKTILQGSVGIGLTSITAFLHIKAGTATASTAPLKFTTGTLNTTPETGAMEFASDFFYLTSNAIRTAISTYGRVVVNSATYTALITDRTIGVAYTATGACTINLPSAALYPNGYEITIKDEGFNATTNNITIDASAAQLIDGNLTSVINTSKDSITIYSNGVDAWFVK